MVSSSTVLPRLTLLYGPGVTTSGTESRQVTSPRSRCRTPETFPGAWGPSIPLCSGSFEKVVKGQI